MLPTQPSTTQVATRVSPSSPSRLFSIALLVATISSVGSTLCFIAYVLVRIFSGAAQQSHFSVLYPIGVIGLLVAEGCQILGVVVLIGQWFSRNAQERKPRELLVLMLSLIPYVPVILFVITLIVYLRARWQDPSSARTQRATQDLKQQTADTAIGLGSQQAQSAAGTPAVQSTQPMVRPTARPTLRDAVRQVVGPSTGDQIAQTANGLLAFTMIALVISMVASVGVGLPAQALTALRSGASGANGAPGHTSLTGTWNLDLHNCSTCGTPTDETYTMTIQQSGNTLTAVATYTGCTSGGQDCSMNMTGSASGTQVGFSSGSYIGNSCQISLAGTITAANQMGGAISFICIGTSVKSYTDGTWTATREAAPTATSAGATSLTGTWTLQVLICKDCANQNETDTMTVQQSGKNLTVSISGSFSANVLTGDITTGDTGETDVNISGTYQGTFQGLPCADGKIVLHGSLDHGSLNPTYKHMSGGIDYVCTSAGFDPNTGNWSATRT